MKKEYKKFVDDITNVLGEARLKSVKYISLDKNKKPTDVSKKIEIVYAVLKKSQAEKAKVLGEEFLQLDVEMKKLKLRHESAKKALRQYTKDFFEAEDEIYTRIIDTSDLTIQITKISERKTLNKDQFFDALYELIPDLKDKVEKLRNKYTEVSAIEPKMSVQPKEDDVTEEGFNEVIGGMADKIKKIAGFFLKGIRFWGREYDSKLSKIKNEFKLALKNPEQVIES